jgi:hypothetical protein
MSVVDVRRVYTEWSDLVPIVVMYTADATPCPMWIVDQMRVEALSKPHTAFIQSFKARHHRSQGKKGQNSEKFVSLIRTR